MACELITSLCGAKRTGGKKMSVLEQKFVLVSDMHYTTEKSSEELAFCTGNELPCYPGKLLFFF